MNIKKMKTKNLMVSFCAIVLALVLATSMVSAADISSSETVTIDGIEVYGTSTNDVSVVAGEDITVKVYFTAAENDTDVSIEAELEGEKLETRAVSENFDVETGKTYKKVLSMKVPYELKDEISNDLTLSIEIDGKEYKTVLSDITVRVQRPSYNAVVKSVTTPSSITAGDSIPVEVVLKNMGYNDLDDVYVSAKIVGTGIMQNDKWFGDLVTLENCDDDCDKEDTVMGRLYLKVPYELDAGEYVLEVTVENDDTETTKIKEIVVNNDFSHSVISASTEKSVKENEEAVFDLLVVNPTDNVKVYRIVADSNEVSVNSQAIVAVPAGSSKTIEVSASASEEGKYAFDVNVLSGDSIVDTVTFGLDVEGSKANTVVVLTVVLAIIFLVLLVVLIVLLGRKPEKSEEFGESYY